MPTYEVFLRANGRDGFAHAGSLQAPDDEMATLYARETYVRRGEGANAWVIRRDHVLAVDPEDLEVTAARTHGLNDGKTIAARRKIRRSAGEQGT